MNAIQTIILIFSFLGAADKLLGDRIGLGKEFERAFSLFAPMALSMLGILVLAPAIGVWLTPAFEGFYQIFRVDPSIVPASLFANDMGGMSLAQQICKSPEVGNFNAFVVSSMMGCVISFTIPFATGLVRSQLHRELFFGLLCGIVTIPVGCFAAGLLCQLPFTVLLADLLPLLLLSGVLAAGLLLVPRLCVKVFTVFGKIMQTVSIAGLACAVFTFLTKRSISEHFDTLENAALICVNACVTLSGALPFMYAVSKLLRKPIGRWGTRLGIDSLSAVAFLSTLVTNASTFGVMEKMSKKGIVVNSAFAASASFVFGSHLAFTMAFDEAYVLPMMVGKLISGICAAVLAFILDKPVGAADRMSENVL